MRKKEFKANLAYLENAGVVVSEDAVWENNPFSRELSFETSAGGDFGIAVEEVTREKVKHRGHWFYIYKELKEKHPDGTDWAFISVKAKIDNIIAAIVRNGRRVVLRLV